MREQRPLLSPLCLPVPPSRLRVTDSIYRLVYDVSFVICTIFLDTYRCSAVKLFDVPAPLIDTVLTLANVKSIRDAQTLAAHGLSDFGTSVQKTRHVVLGFRRVVGGGCAILQIEREWDVDHNSGVQQAATNA